MNESKRQDDPESLLCDYLDGRLSHRQRRLLDKRIEQDDDLREHLRQYAALDGLFEQLAGQDVDGFDFHQQRREIVAAAERKALVGAKRYRPVYLRPVFVGLAAAASLLLLAGAAVILLHQPVVTPESAPAVSVRMLPASQRPTGREIVSVTLSVPIGQGSFQPPRPTTAKMAAPRGTVVVSAGARKPAASRAPDMMLIY